MIDQIKLLNAEMDFLKAFIFCLFSNETFLFYSEINLFKKNQFSTKNARFDDCLEEKNIEFISDIFIREYAISVKN